MVSPVYRSNKLTAAEYDETTWSARTWLSFVYQRLSVAVHKAVAREVQLALGFSAAVDPRGARGECEVAGFLGVVRGDFCVWLFCLCGCLLVAGCLCARCSSLVAWRVGSAWWGGAALPISFLINSFRAQNGNDERNSPSVCAASLSLSVAQADDSVGGHQS